MKKIDKEKETIDNQNKDIEPNKEKETTKNKPKTRRDLSSELRAKRDNIELEVLNISTGGCAYYDSHGEPYFNLVPGQSTIVSLREIQDVCLQAKCCFDEYYLIITDVYNKDYTLEDILIYLGLSDTYRDIKNYNEDYLQKILLEYDDKEFESLISIKDSNFAKMLAAKAIYLFVVEKQDISRGKEHVLKQVLKLEALFPEEE